MDAVVVGSQIRHCKSLLLGGAEDLAVGKLVQALIKPEGEG
jgi:hypothetical protein